MQLLLKTEYGKLSLPVREMRILKHNEEYAFVFHTMALAKAVRYLISATTKNMDIACNDMKVHSFRWVEIDSLGTEVTLIGRCNGPSNKIAQFFKRKS
jgi:hypothetical protein